MELLSETGLVVDSAANGVQAVEMVQNVAYDVILMDMQMRKNGRSGSNATNAQIPGRAKHCRFWP